MLKEGFCRIEKFLQETGEELARGCGLLGLLNLPVSVLARPNGTGKMMETKKDLNEIEIYQG